MSIPKEPRGLMINLMYLVLTAMLALNVSAEIINAFFSLEKGIKHTNTIIVDSNKKTLEGMATLNETKKGQFTALVEAAKKVNPIVEKLVKLIDESRDAMVKESGGSYPDVYPDNPKYAGKPKGYKDIDVPQRLFVEQGGGKKIKDQILATKEELKALLTSTFSQTMPGVEKVSQARIDSFVNGLPLDVDEESWKTSGKPSWEAFTFGYMPVAALYPLFRKWQNDAYSSETAVINFLADKMGKLELKFDQFAVFSASSKPYIMKGETYTASISLGALSSQAKFSISVNGSSLPIKEGNAVYTTTGNSLGEQRYKATANLQNPATGENISVSREFSFEVGQPSVNVSADKMNVFYIGVDNPISIAAAGVSSNDVSVSGAGGGISLSGSGNSRVVKVNAQGEATITVSDKKANKKLGDFKFRVKRIPDPVVKLANKTGGVLGTGEMKAQLGLIPMLENFDFEAKCEIQSYVLYYTKKRSDPVEIKGSGGRFADQAANAIKAAAIGDQYQFVDVKAKCPGDSAGRTVNSLAFTIR